MRMSVELLKTLSNLRLNIIDIGEKYTNKKSKETNDGLMDNADVTAELYEAIQDLGDVVAELAEALEEE